MKIDRLQLINASARYQLLSANQQLLDFHLSRIMQQKLRQKNGPLTRKQTILKEKIQQQNESNQLNPIAEESHLKETLPDSKQNVREHALDLENSTALEIKKETLEKNQNTKSLKSVRSAKSINSKEG